MRIPRIYLPAPLTSGKHVVLDPRAARHVIKVLRLRPGAPLVLFNGEGGEYAATLERGPRDAPSVLVGDYAGRSVESPLRLHLAQGVARGERMDYVIQKAVELGVSEITPIWTERCVVRLDSDRQARRVEHWRGVAIGAAEQSGRDRVPPVHMPLTFDDWLDASAQDLCLVLDPLAEHGLSATPATHGQVRLLVGPEGGLTEAELTRARVRGYRGIRLGPRILRTETAGVAALTVLQALWGDLSS